MSGTDTITGATGNDTVTGGTTTTTTTTTTPKVLTEQQKADSLRMSLLKAKAKQGQALVDDDAIFYMIGDSVVSAAVMQALDNGKGYDDLRILGLTDGQATDCLLTYNIKISPQKYESESAIDLIDADKMIFKSFLDYLHTNNVELPDFTALYTSIRSKPAIYAALRDWNKTRAI